jgi:hypothetical protein
MQNWKTYTYKNMSFQYPPQGWVVVFNSTIAGQSNGFDLGVIKESQQNLMQPNGLSLSSWISDAGKYALSANKTFIYNSNGDSYIQFKIGSTTIYAGCGYYQQDQETFNVCNQIVSTVTIK